MIAVLRQRDFSLLWFGGVLSVVGDFFLFIALPFFVYERTVGPFEAYGKDRTADDNKKVPYPHG